MKARLIDINRIHGPQTLLRPVLKSDISYLELKASVEKYGVICSILVVADGDGYEVIAGNRRFNAAKDAGLKRIPCIIYPPCSAEKKRALQITENANQFQTRAGDYYRQLLTIHKKNQDYTVFDLAEAVGKSPAWVQKILHLKQLDPDIQEAVFRGEIKTEMAVWLAKLPRDRQMEFLPQTQLITCREFVARVQQALRNKQQEKERQYFDKRFAERFQPVRYLRTIDAIESELRTQKVGLKEVVIQSLTPSQAWEAALQWALHGDKESIEAQEAAFYKSGNTGNLLNYGQRSGNSASESSSSGHVGDL